MFGLGVGEMLVIGAIALLFVGPDKLPQMMREFGRYYGQLRRAADDLRRAFVLEADRQDAAERYRQLQERRKAAQEARKRAEEAAGAPEKAPDAPGELTAAKAPEDRPSESVAELPGLNRPELSSDLHHDHDAPADASDASDASRRAGGAR